MAEMWEHNGETLTIAQWAKRLGKSPRVLRLRHQRYGMSIEETLTVPFGVGAMHAYFDLEEMKRMRALKRPVKAMSEELGVSVSTINRWLKRLDMRKKRVPKGETHE